MFILEPISVETIWGSNRLHSYCGDVSLSKIGQLYTVAAQKNISNVIINGEYEGTTLYEMFQKHRELFGYEASEVFPLLIGFVDASDHLSIQVHPTDAYAREAEKMPFGKSESWVFIEPPKSGEIFNGLKCNTIEELKENISAGTVMNVVDTLKVAKGDYVYVENGTIHALSRGSLVYEIQQSTDITYRFYDYDRTDSQGKKRPLHLDKALSVIQPHKKSQSIPYIENKPYIESNYITEMRNISQQYKNALDTFACVTVLKGALYYDDCTIKPGMSFVVLPKTTVKLDGNAECIIATIR